MSSTRLDKRLRHALPRTKKKVPRKLVIANHARNMKKKARRRNSFSIITSHHQTLRGDIEHLVGIREIMPPKICDVKFLHHGFEHDTPRAV